MVIILLRITATMTTFGFFPVATRRATVEIECWLEDIGVVC